MKVLGLFTFHGSCITVQTGQAFRRTKIIGRTITSRGRDYTTGNVHKDNFIVTFLSEPLHIKLLYLQLNNTEAKLVL